MFLTASDLVISNIGDKGIYGKEQNRSSTNFDINNEAYLALHNTRKRLSSLTRHTGNEHVLVSFVDSQGQM